MRAPRRPWWGTHKSAEVAGGNREWEVIRLEALGPLHSRACTVAQPAASWQFTFGCFLVPLSQNTNCTSNFGTPAPIWRIHKQPAREVRQAGAGSKHSRLVGGSCVCTSTKDGRPGAVTSRFVAAPAAWHPLQPPLLQFNALQRLCRAHAHRWRCRMCASPLESWWVLAGGRQRRCLACAAAAAVGMAKVWLLPPLLQLAWHPAVAQQAPALAAPARRPEAPQAAPNARR